MPERKHNLTSRYERLEDQITTDVLDSIAAHPRSDGRSICPASTAQTAAARAPGGRPIIQRKPKV